MNEVWKSCVGFPGYEVSNLGRVRSLEMEKWGGPVAGFYTQAGRILRPGIASTGYPTVALGRGNTRTVHSLVSDAFLGPLPHGMEVRHDNGIRSDPRLSNLLHGTRSQNIADAYRHGTKNPEADCIRAAKMLVTKDTKYPGWRSQPFTYFQKGGTRP